MLEIPSDILELFFREIKLKGKYEVDIRGNSAYIIPRVEERYYKPIIRIPDLDYLEILLVEYVEAVNNYNKKNNTKLREYHDLAYVFNIMLFNMASSDAEDLNKFIEERISFFNDTNLEELNAETKIFEHNDNTFYAQRETEEFGLETPYIMTFKMKTNGETFQLPMIRYAVNDNGTCYIYAVQIGRKRTCATDNEKYKKAVNPANQGVKEGRSISPSFVLILAMFLKILNDNGISKIVIPDYLFNRYKKYYRANTTIKSDEILSRMLHNITTLVRRMDIQIDGFDIESYPLDIDSYYHIKINSLSSKNKMFKKLLNGEDINN